MRGQRDAPETLVRRYEWTLFARVLGANMFLLLTLGLYVFLLIPVYDPRASTARLLARLLPPGISFVVLCYLQGLLAGRRRWRRTTRWLTENRLPTPEERKDLYAIPRRLATIPLTYWALGLLWTLPYFYYVQDFRPGLMPYYKTAVAFVLLALVGWSLSHLLVERAIRPIVARAMSAGAEAPKTMNTVTRLLIAWAATSGIPIGAIMLTVVALDDAAIARARTGLYVVCIGGFISGVIVAAFAGRAIADPIRKVRAGMGLIEHGDFDADVPVTDTAELGDLEIGFNRMTAGLRERERMRDIFGRHVGPDVAKRALESEHGLGGERHEVSVLFVDIIGSTGLAENREPDEVVAILNAFFETVVRCVAAEGGFVNKFEGDGAVCIVGAPIAYADHAARALRAGRALAAELGGMRGDIGAAIGISSGPVVAGNIGTSDRYEYTVIGDPVNEASRLCDVAKTVPSHILASDRTIGLAGTEDDCWIAGDAVRLRGRSRDTQTYTTT